MKKRLFLYAALVICVEFVSFFAISVYIAHANNLKLAKDSVMESAKICAGLYSEDTDLSLFVKAGETTRITVVAPDGSVMADSRPLDLEEMEDHLTRPEIKAAAAGSPETYVRRSESLGVDFIYYALKAGGGDSYVFVRAALPVAKIDAYLFQYLPLLVILFAAISLSCFFFIRKMIERILTPFEFIEKKLLALSEGEYAPGHSAESYQEINKMTQKIDEIAYALQNSFNELREEKNKLGYILNNIGDGLFVIDENKNIALVNLAALGIFNANSEVAGKNLNYLTYDKTLSEAVDECISNEKDALFEQSLNGRIFCVAVKRLPETKLTMAALSDVTEARENAKRREEFFANASHELKTPLTAIKGFTELTAINNKDENIKKYIDGIIRETDRMLSLIGDMLKLSELENARQTKAAPVSLAKVANEAREVLSAAISEKSLSFEISGDAEITAEPGHIYELVKNIVENAVRYNEQNGRVEIIIGNDKKCAKLTVSDNGIGISPSEQTRIFERFYRIEKSRSQRGGGTGLGLAIVKHICALYDWNLSLKSKLGIGTEITVSFVH
ncbi:MAG: ATP-binding protein [Oscillospiraceae bacterium]|nr:ATP-binding protein [Oscillospiraceae bacterium]